jgi:hypothetical protein
MKYFSEKDGFVNGECEHCNKILKIRQEQAIPTPTGFSLNPPGGVRCFCGTVHHSIEGTTQNTGMIFAHSQSRGAEEQQKKKIKWMIFALIFFGFMFYTDKCSDKTPYKPTPLTCEQFKQHLRSCSSKTGDAYVNCLALLEPPAGCH